MDAFCFDFPSVVLYGVCSFLIGVVEWMQTCFPQVESVLVVCCVSWHKT